MTRITTVLLAALFLLACQAHAQAHVVRVTGANGTGILVFSDGVNGSFRSLHYENSRGGRLYIFDSGLEFNYADESDPYLSPDKTHFFVNFSATSSTEDDASSVVESKEYMCAFVRMSDGCVVQVTAGEICGGKWDAKSRWIGIDGSTVGNLDMNILTVDNVYGEYSSRIKDKSATSSPKILKYLSEGTAFDNLLACDPVGQRNKIFYKKLFKLLSRDGDSVDAKKILKAMAK